MRKSKGKYGSRGRHAEPDSFAPTNAAGGIAVVAGYRILRTLGVGSRATVYLGHGQPVGPGDGALASTVAVKAFHPGVESASIDREIAALAGATSENTVRLLDVASLPGSQGAREQTAIVLEQLGSGTLSRLLARRPCLGAGEAVTILAPLFQAVCDLHERGFAHGRLSQNRVLFDAVGRPVLIGFGHCTAPEPGAATEPGATTSATRIAQTPRRRRVSASMVVDYQHLAAIAHAVLDPIASVPPFSDRHSQGPGPIADFLAAVDGVREGAWLDEMAELDNGIFRIARAVPVTMEAEPSAPAPVRDLPLRVGAASAPDAVSNAAPDVAPPEEPTDTADRAQNRVGSLLRHAAVPTEIAERIQRVLDARPMRAGRGRLAGWIGARKKPVIIACALGAGLVIAAMSVLPPGDGTAGHAAVQRPATAAPTKSAGDAMPSTRPTVAPAAVMADDPVAAAKALLAMRSACVRQRSAACLSGVDQPDSALLKSDRAMIGGSAAATPNGVLEQDAEPHLIQRVGGSALVAVPNADPAGAATEPETVLLMKTSSGWRLREIFIAQSVTGS